MDDHDMDGIPDETDIDDDNDGILDAVESPGCFYSFEEAKSMIQISSDHAALEDFSHLYDGSMDLVFRFANGSFAIGDAIFTIEYPTPIELSQIVVSNRVSYSGGATARLYGSIDGLSWNELTTNNVSLFAQGSTYTVNSNAGQYKYYEIRSMTTGGLIDAYNIAEITPTYSSGFIPSLSPKPSCTDDNDGDGMVNHMDLDSDGDGCYDSYEAGVAGSTLNGSYTDSLVIPQGQTTGIGGNGLADHIETIAESNEVNYSHTYQYAQTSAWNACIDSDGDGINDIDDLDDDNDGILDVDECAKILIPVASDGSFNGLAPIASYDVFNNTVEGGGYFSGSVTPDSWNCPVYTTGSGRPTGLADGMPCSNDGSVFVAGGMDGSAREAIYTIIDGLTVGQIYVVEFEQGNAGVDGFTSIGNQARWEVHFGSGIKYSTLMPYLGEGNQVWMRESLEFVATSTSQRLEFFVHPGADGIVGMEYMALDGVKLYLPTQYCDDDGDGIYNHLDLDSDNDGIYDIVEAGNVSVIALDVDGNGIIEGSEYTDADMDGLSDDVENIVSSNLTSNLGVTPAETTYGIYDFLNIDSDGDGCVDAIEAYNDVFADSNGDGSYGGEVEVFNNEDISNIYGVDELGRVNAASYPGTDARVTDANISPCVPDFRPELVLSNSIVIGATGNIDFVVNIEELNNYSIDNGVPIQFTITKDSRIQINWNAGLVGAFNGNPFLQVNNTEWTYDGSNPFAHIWTYNIAGEYPALSIKKIGINAVYTVPATGIGTHSLNVIIPFTNVGGERNIDNNISSDIINLDNN
ncbi:hypothetical protein GCM10025777_56300 [Membranihabitans marinus]